MGTKALRCPTHSFLSQNKNHSKICTWRLSPLLQPSPQIHTHPYVWAISRPQITSTHVLNYPSRPPAAVSPSHDTHTVLGDPSRSTCGDLDPSRDKFDAPPAAPARRAFHENRPRLGTVAMTVLSARGALRLRERAGICRRLGRRYCCRPECCCSLCGV